MTISAEYYSSGANNFIDLSYSPSGTSAKNETFLIYGSAGDDWVYVPAGVNVDFSDAGTGNNRLYLTGLFSDYQQEIVDADYGIYALTRIANLPSGDTEVVWFSSTSENDYVYFQDGKASISSAALKASGSYQLIDASDLDASDPTPLNPRAIPDLQNTGTTYIYVTKGGTTGIPAAGLSGQSLVITGSAGDDVAFVTPGSNMDFSDSGTGHDTLYLTGKFSDYVQTLDNEYGIYTFTRTAGLPAGRTEVVSFRASYDLESVYFADGSVDLQLGPNAPTYVAGPLQPNQLFRYLEFSDLNTAVTTPDLDTTPPATPLQAGIVNDASGPVLTLPLIRYDSPTLTLPAPPGIGEIPLLLIDGSVVSSTYDSATQTLSHTMHLTDGLHTIAYALQDDYGNISAASPSVSLNVEVVNQTPSAVDDVAVAIEAGVSSGSDAVGNVLDNDVDTDGGEVLQVTGLTGATVGTAYVSTYGSLTLNSDGSFSYTADDGNALVDALRVSGDTLTENFTYTVTDSQGATSVAVLSVTINGANDAPVAQDDTAAATEGGVVAGSDATGNVNSNDTDVDTGDSLTVSAVSAASAGTVGGTTAGLYGTLTLNADGSYTYVVDDANPAVDALLDATETLIDTFTYTVSDLANATSVAILSVTINGANDALVAQDDTGVAVEGGVAAPGNATGNVKDNDTDVDANDILTVSAVSAASAGTVGGTTTGIYGDLTLNADGSYTYAVDDSNPVVDALWTATDTLMDTFTYTLQDVAGEMSVAELSITINGSNDAPTVVVPIDDQLSVRGQAIADILTAASFADVDAGDSLTYSMSGAPTGIAIDSATGKISGTPMQAGSFDIVVTATDANAVAASVQDTFNLNVDDAVLLLPGQTIENLTKLDVQSPIVLTFDQNVALGTGEIRIMDDMGINGLVVTNTTTNLSAQDTYDNDVVISLTNGAITKFMVGNVDKTSEAAGSLTVSGQNLIINPSGDHSAAGNTAWNFDWDFGTDYHIEMDAGVLVSAASGAPSEELSGTDMKFSTVTPAPDATGAPSVKINSSTGQVESSYTWHSAHVSKVSAAGVSMDFEDGPHAIAILSSVLARQTQLPGRTSLSYFGFTSSGTVTADDLIYNDNLGNMNMDTTEALVNGQSTYAWSPSTSGPYRGLSVDGGNGTLRVYLENTPSGWTAINRDDTAENATHYNANVIVFG